MTTYKCPKCSGSDLRIELPAVFSMDKDGYLENDDGADDPRNHIHSYADTAHFTMCNGCEHEGTLAEFTEREIDG